ncbi:MAG: MotA/TolQ/ExbB proton channel family protein [Deltaproteobacteria bacterium]|nr:MotA/TolQ/ExbB proton channel family protein [Deltaproteobacteria bacterium]
MLIEIQPGRRFAGLWLAALVLAASLAMGGAAFAQPGAQQAAPQGQAAEVAVAPGFPATSEGIQLPGEEGEEAPAQTVFGLFRKGGITMYFILLVSILALAIVFERVWNLRESKIISTGFLEEIKRHWYRRATDAAIEVCQSHDSAISRVLRAGLLRFDLGLEQVENAIETAGQHEATLLRKNLMFLGFLANVAPMLGLFGTVLGMIKSFDAIALYGTSGNPGLVASGISEALITTAYGLMVGIPTLAAYFYLKRKVEMRVLEMEEIAVNLMQDLAQWRGEPVANTGRAAGGARHEVAGGDMTPKAGVVD